jgi:hypothetical protein
MAASAADSDVEGGEEGKLPRKKRRRSKHIHQQKAKKERKKDSKRRRSEAQQRALAETAALEEVRGEAYAATEAGIAAFEAYYLAQGLCASKTSDGAEELSQVVKALLKPLPISFRVCADARRAEETERGMSQVMSLLEDQSLGANFAADPAVFWKWCGAWQVRLLWGDADFCILPSGRLYFTKCCASSTRRSTSLLTQPYYIILPSGCLYFTKCCASSTRRSTSLLLRHMTAEAACRKGVPKKRFFRRAEKKKRCSISISIYRARCHLTAPCHMTARTIYSEFFAAF